PQTGRYQGQPGYVEVVVTTDYDSRFLKVLDGILTRQVAGRAVAGRVPGSIGAAIVVLDPDPESLSIANIGSDLEELDPVPLATAATAQSGILPHVALLPVIGPLASQLLGNSLGNVVPGEITSTLEEVVDALPVGPPPSLLAGFESEGLGCLRVDGAIYVSSEWGQVDQSGNLVGC